MQKALLERKFTTREMVRVGMFAAVLAVISQISLPMPTGVPITIQVFGVALVGAVLGSRLGTTATLVYVLLGAIGLPIFANFSGGISSIVGVTGGYIWAWPIMTWLAESVRKQSCCGNTCEGVAGTAKWRGSICTDIKYRQRNQESVLYIRHCKGQRLSL